MTYTNKQTQTLSQSAAPRDRAGLCLRAADHAAERQLLLRGGLRGLPGHRHLLHAGPGVRAVHEHRRKHRKYHLLSMFTYSPCPCPSTYSASVQFCVFALFETRLADSCTQQTDIYIYLLLLHQHVDHQ